MTCPVTQDLNKYNSELEKQAKEERYNEENPKYYWDIKTANWEDYAETPEDLAELTALAMKENLNFTINKKEYIKPNA